MRRNSFSFLLIVLLLAICVPVSGVFALWYYYGLTEAPPQIVSTSLSEFKYGTLYITKVEVVGGSYASAQAVKTGDLDIQADLALHAQAGSTVTVEVTFYNNTDSSFYYNKTDATSWDNDSISYTVSGIEKQDEIPGKTFRTLQVTFAYDGSDYSAASLAGGLHFNFVVDKDSIGTIVALTAVDRFKAILNNEVSENSYQTLEDAMNNRSGFNKASAVTYIGNVAGSSSGDSGVIQTLFTSQFLSMDLDGDGKAEPITIMIKRENLDDDTTTGDSYTYTTSSWWGSETSHTVHGAEMTMYITSVDLNNVSNDQPVEVYAVSFTKLPDADKWTELVPLTKGTAEANNYSGYGSANSFNTDTWLSDQDKTIEELVG